MKRFIRLRSYRTLHGFLSEVDRTLVLLIVDGEDVGFTDFPIDLDKEDFGGVLIVDEELDFCLIQVKAINGDHLNARMRLAVVFVFDPGLGFVV